MSGVYTNIAKKRAEQSVTSVLPAEPTSAPQFEPAQHHPIARRPQSEGAPPEQQMSTNPQPHLSTNKSALSTSEKPEKYTTHLEPSLVKRVKLFATERDMKDYQVVRDALLLYFDKNK
jgi:hypothetical protein